MDATLRKPIARSSDLGRDALKGELLFECSNSLSQYKIAIISIREKQADMHDGDQRDIDDMKEGTCTTIHYMRRT